MGLGYLDEVQDDYRAKYTKLMDAAEAAAEEGEDFAKALPRVKHIMNKALKIASVVSGPIMGVVTGLLSEFLFDDPNKAEIEDLKLKTCCNNRRIKQLTCNLTKQEENSLLSKQRVFVDIYFEQKYGEPRIFAFFELQMRKSDF